MIKEGGKLKKIQLIIVGKRGMTHPSCALLKLSVQGDKMRSAQLGRSALEVFNVKNDILIHNT